MAKMSYLTLDAKGRATLPEEVREALGVGPGDFVLLERTEAGGYELVPAALVPTDQRWFQHPEMVRRVRDAEAEIAKGRSRRESVTGLAARVGVAAHGGKTGARKRSVKSRAAKSKAR